MTRPATTHAELADAILWVDASTYGAMSAWFCRDTGKILYGGDPDSDAELPAPSALVRHAERPQGTPQAGVNASSPQPAHVAT